jgi:hypothetical protein
MTLESVNNIMKHLLPFLRLTLGETDPESNAAIHDRRDFNEFDLRWCILNADLITKVLYKFLLKMTQSKIFVLGVELTSHFHRGNFINQAERRPCHTPTSTSIVQENYKCDLNALNQFSEVGSVFI